MIRNTEEARYDMKQNLALLQVQYLWQVLMHRCEAQLPEDDLFEETKHIQHMQLAVARQVTDENADVCNVCGARVAP